MKKRIFSVLLALIMLVSLVPAAAISASAAAYSISERAITVLKQMEGYSKYCNSNGYIGYGTLCQSKGAHDGSHAMTEKQADKALRETLKDLDKAISTFAANNGVALSQNKHDALVVFSFQNGTAWTTGTGAFKQAVVKGMSGSDFLNAICNFRADIGDDNRRMVEANMYLNGVYSSSRPSNFIRVTYDAGEMEVADFNLDDSDAFEDDDYYNSVHYGSLNNANPNQYYDASSLPAPHLVPTMEGGIFLGWYYVDNYGDNILVTSLDSSFHGATLIAGWQYFGATFDDDDDGVQDLEDLHSAHYNMNTKQLKDKSIYASPFAEKPMTALDAKGKSKDLLLEGQFVVDKEYVDENNTKWGHVITGEYKLKGEKETTYFSYYDDGINRWVKLGDIKTNADAAEIPEVDVDVTVTNTYVNRRERASINSAKNGSYNYGQQLRIIATKQNDGFLWGQVATSAKDNTPVGWIALMYTNFDSIKTQTNVNTSVAIAKAVVSYQGYLNVRSGAGTENSIVAALSNGTQVDIYEIKYVNGHQWGRCNTGWICLSYTNLTYLTAEAPDFSNDAGYISYVFSGTLLNSFRLQVREHPGQQFDPIITWERINPAVTITNLTAVWDEDTEQYITWGKIPQGWIQVSDAAGNPIDVVLNTAKFTVVNENVTVRETPSTGANRVDALGMNVEFNVNDENENGDYIQVVVVGDSVWGYATKVGEENATYGGWVNLATKYVSRNGVNVGASEDTTTGGTGTGTTGLGIVSNTYTGVNVRTAPGTGNPAIGKIPAGTTINIYETKTHGAAQWGRTDKGWVCMDYVTMVGDLPADVLAALGGSTGSTGSAGGSVTSSQVAVFTGYANQDDVVIYKEASLNSDPVRTLGAFDPVTIHELLTTTEIVETNVENGNDVNTTTTTKVTYNWARVNDGYIYSPGDVLELDPLDEVSYTVVNTTRLNVRETPGDGAIKFKLNKGEVVIVTSLDIWEGKMWAKVEAENLDEWGWASMEYLTRGVVNTEVKEEVNSNAGSGSTNTTPTEPIIGSTGNTGSTAGATGYLYTGKVIRTNQVNVRAYASTGAAVSTTLKSGASLVIYETTISEGMAWGRCDSGWVYLYYVDLTPVTYGVVDAKVVYTEGTVIYSDSSCTEAIGSYSRMSVVDIYEIVGKMARTDAGWVNVDNLG